VLYKLCYNTDEEDEHWSTVRIDKSDIVNKFTPVKTIILMIHHSCFGAIWRCSDADVVSVKQRMLTAMSDTVQIKELHVDCNCSATCCTCEVSQLPWSPPVLRCMLCSWSMQLQLLQNTYKDTRFLAL